MSETLYYEPHEGNQITISSTDDLNIITTHSAPIPELPDDMSLLSACLMTSLVCKDYEGNNITPELQLEWVNCEYCHCGDRKDGE